CTDALTYVLVERSAVLRRRQREHSAFVDPALALPPPGDDPSVPTDGPDRGLRLVSLAELPRVAIRGVVLANELLDNLPFGLLVRRADGWDEVRVGLDGKERPAEVLVPASGDELAIAQRAAPEAAPGARIPVQHAAGAWLADARSIVEAGRVVAID